MMIQIIFTFWWCLTTRLMALTVSCPGDWVGTWSAASAPQCFELRMQSPADSSDQLKGLHPLSTQHGRRFGKDASPTNQLLRCSINSITTAIQQPFNSHSTANEVKAQQDPLTMGETPETIWLLIPCDISNGALFTGKKAPHNA